MPTRTRFAEGSQSGDRATAAFARTCDSYRRVQLLAKHVAEELDEITSPGVIQQFDEEDSLVTTVSAVLAGATKS
jgi:hypothetical protein